jgi:hypothetical protein
MRSLALKAVTAASDFSPSASEAIPAALQSIAGSKAFDASEQNGRSTRIHALVEGKGRPLHFVLTSNKRARQQIFGFR